MKKKIKLWKIIFSSTSLFTLGATTSSIVSCGNQVDLSWATFAATAQKEKAINIVVASKISNWKNLKSQNFTIANITVNKNLRTITVLINDIIPKSSATFTITYQGQKYNDRDWVYNNDFNYDFDPSGSIPSNTIINDIAQFNSIVYAWNYNEIFTSNDNGARFKKHKLSTLKYRIKTLVVIGDIVYLETNGGLYTASVRDLNFSQNSQIENGYPVNKVIKINNIIYVGTYYGLYSSIDNGETFIQDPSILPNDSINQITEINNITYVATDLGLFSAKKTDVKFYINNSIPFSEKIDQITEINNIIYAIGYSNYDLYGSIFTSINNGSTFIKNNSVPSSYHINQISKINKTLYLATNMGLLSSQDNGKTFLQNNSIPQQYHLKQIIAIDNIIYIASAMNGLLNSWDGGLHFTINHSITINKNHISTINKIINLGNFIYVATNTGFYRYTLNPKK